MKIALFKHGDERCLGRVDGSELDVLAVGDDTAALMLRLIQADVNERDALVTKASKGKKVRLSEVTLLPPVPDHRGAVLCVGKNYYAHAKEFFGSGFDSSAKEEVPSQPVIFAKTGSCLVGHGATVNSALDATNTVDYEGELALIIGKTAHKVSKADAWDVIFGYTICNDVTSRELQKRHNQWLIGKSLDTFGPLGPFIVTADEMGDITSQTLTTRVNGEVRQQAAISDLVFDIPTLIETLTRTMTLYPGDVIATGTPAGVGIGFIPPKYLKAGDVVDVDISGIGTLTNTII